MTTAATSGLVVGGVDVGVWMDAYNADLGAVLKARNDPAARRQALASLRAKSAQMKAAAAKQAALAPLAKMTTAASAAARSAITAAAQLRVKQSADYLNQPTHVIPVCFDAVGAAGVSGIATISSPHNRAWRVLGFLVNDNQTNGMRITSLKIANTEHIVASNVTFSAGTPTQPGVDASIFTTKGQAQLLPQYRYRPWGLGNGGVLRPDAVILMQVFNPSATAQSLNVSWFVQSTPCGDDALYSKSDKGVFPIGSEEHDAFMNQVQIGDMNRFPRAIPRGARLTARR